MTLDEHLLPKWQNVQSISCLHLEATGTPGGDSAAI